MLNQLHIHNFAIIHELTLELSTGMTVLSGETGAGKSILVDALGLLLGDRADTDAILPGAGRAEVTAQCSLDDLPAARQWLEENDLLDDTEPETCVLRRVLLQQGRTRAYINGRPCNARDLKTLGEMIIDIHGQHAHQSLMRPEIQRDILDACSDCESELKATAEHARRHGEITRRIHALAGDDGNREQRREFLRFQVDELEALALADDELATLEEEHRKLAHAERLLREGHEALGMLYERDEGTAHGLLGNAHRLLADLAEIDPAFNDAAEMVDSAAIQTREAADDIRNHLTALEADPHGLETVESRLAAINDMARKHGVEPDALGQRLQTLQAELAELEGGEEKLQALTEEREIALADYNKSAEKLGKKRAAGSKALAEAVTREIRDLGLPQGTFEIALPPRESATPNAAGNEVADFRVSANPEHPPRPLAKVASGGELSRISLAIQVIAARAQAAPCRVFDEVDTGIGGGVAEIVGRRLRRLADHRQVLCVTHLPQVAAQGHHHIRVSKATSGKETRTAIEHLDGKASIEELARMLGGVEITQQTRAHAQEMKEQATRRQ